MQTHPNGTPQVGTSFTAFRYQPNGCARAPGSCLRGQLKDLYEEDAARVGAGMAPLYSVRQYGHGLGGSIGRRGAWQNHSVAPRPLPHAELLAWCV